MPRKRVDWRAVQALYDAGHGRDACMREFGFCLDAWYKAIRRGALRATLQRRDTYDWSEIQRFYDAGNAIRVCQQRFGFTTGAWAKAVRRGLVRPRPLRWPLARVLASSRWRSVVKSALLREGIFENRCDLCGIESWRGRPLSMQLDHVNGIRDDHRVENLRMLCPNCHSQTETFGARNRKGVGTKNPRRGPG